MTGKDYVKSLGKRQVHLDFHTSEHIADVGWDFDPDEFGQTLELANVDSITCFARCHHGWLYYPSKKHPEMIHPGLANKNLLLDQIKACHARGIKVPIYTTVQWDGYISRNKPEWLCEDEDGKWINTQGVSEPHFYYSICLNSGYQDYFKDHLRDLIDVVGADNLDGIFMDILFKTDCSCKHCLSKMKELSIDTSDKLERLRYSGIMLEEFKEEISALIGELAPATGIFYNGSHVGYGDKKSLPFYSHLELESLPSGGWGYDHFPITMRYSRKLGKEVVGMTGKFHTYWGDFHSLKNKEALEFECFNMLALGAKCSIGDQLHPSGRLSPAAYDLIGGVYGQVKALEDDIFKADIPRVEIGVLTPEESWIPGGESPKLDPALIGANRLLQELNYQFDIIDSQMDFSPYRLIIMPDVIAYDKDLEAKLIKFADGGGKLLASFIALQKEEGYRSKLYGTEYLGEGDFDRDFVVPGDRIGRSLPQEEFVMYLKGAKVKSIEGEVLLDSVKPYFNREGDRFCSHQHSPSSGEIGYPAAVQNKNSIYFSHPIFTIYRKNAPRWIKELLKDALEILLDKKILRHSGPSSLLTTINTSEDYKTEIIHCLNYIAQKKSEDIYIIDEIIPLYNIEFSVEIGDRQVDGVKILPEEKSIEYRAADGFLNFELDKIEGHKVIRIDFA